MKRQVSHMTTCPQKVGRLRLRCSGAEGQYLFTGRRLDEETGLYYYRARYYDVELGRFIGRDPIGYIDGASLYRGYFVPNGLDPFGLEFQIGSGTYYWPWEAEASWDPRRSLAYDAAGVGAAVVTTGEVLEIQQGRVVEDAAFVGTGRGLVGFGAGAGDEALSTGTLTVLLIARPPGSRRRSVMRAFSGRVVSGNAGSGAMISARPSASVRGRSASGVRTGVASSSANPKT